VAGCWWGITLVLCCDTAYRFAICFKPEFFSLRQPPLFTTTTPLFDTRTPPQSPHLARFDYCLTRATRCSPPHPLPCVMPMGFFTKTPLKLRRVLWMWVFRGPVIFFLFYPPAPPPSFSSFPSPGFQEAGSQGVLSSPNFLKKNTYSFVFLSEIPFFFPSPPFFFFRFLLLNITLPDCGRSRISFRVPTTNLSTAFLGARCRASFLLLQVFEEPTGDVFRQVHQVSSFLSTFPCASFLPLGDFFVPFVLSPTVLVLLSFGGAPRFPFFFVVAVGRSRTAFFFPFVPRLVRSTPLNRSQIRLHLPRLWTSFFELRQFGRGLSFQDVGTAVAPVHKKPIT